jgi:hypothetical protein
VTSRKEGDRRQKNEGKVLAAGAIQNSPFIIRINLAPSPFSEDALPPTT